MKDNFKLGTNIAITVILLLSLAVIVFFVHSIFKQRQENYETTVKGVMIAANYNETMLRFQKVGPEATARTGIQVTPITGVGVNGENKNQWYISKRYVSEAQAEEKKKNGDDFDKLFNGNKKTKEDIQATITAGINAALKGVAEIDFEVYDSLLVKMLKEKGIETPYKLEISYQDSAVLNRVTGTPDFSRSLIYSFRNELPLDSEGKVKYVYTSSPFRHIFYNFYGIIILSALAFIIIIAALIYLIRLMSALRETKEIQEEFTHLVTHNMSNPIAIALASAESINNKETGSADTKQYLSIIIRQISKLDEQVKSILKPYKIASLPSDFLKQNIILSEEIKSLLEQTKLSHPEAEFTMDVPDGATIRANSSMFYEMITNLVQNAVKYSPDHPQIKLSYKEDNVSGYLSVKDNGKGIEPEKIKHLFDKFYKTEALSSTPGYGLGLYYVDQVAKKHGWDIRVDSTPGQGSEFTVVIPK